MKIAVEISMYPLNKEYEKPILKFIDYLNKIEDVEIITNKMSTQIFGPYDVVFPLLQKEIKRAFEENDTTIFVSKMFRMKEG